MVSDKIDFRAHYLDLAQAWEDRAEPYRGRTLENGWTHRELYDAETRRLQCEAMRDKCLAKAATYPVR